MSDPSPPSKPAPNARWWVKAFVVFQVIAVTVWAIPNPGPQYKNGSLGRWAKGGTLQGDITSIVDNFLLDNYEFGKNGPIRFYNQSTGFWQYWDMFAPNPSGADLWGNAKVFYKDGTAKMYQFPRVYLMNIYEKYAGERYRKYFERAHLDDKKYFRDPFAQRVALINTKDPANPVVRVMLYRHSQDVAPIGTPQPTEYSETMFHDYQVDQAKLARDLRG